MLFQAHSTNGIAEATGGARFVAPATIARVANLEWNLPMARLARLTIPGLPHLVVQRSSAQRAVFAEPDDCAAFVAALRDAAAAPGSGVSLHAYALLGDAALLLVTPRDEPALGRFVQRVNRRFAPWFNRRHGAAGPLWAGRFQAAAIDPEHYLLACIRLIERAPVRAGLVADARDWPWSSAAHHLGLAASDLITEHPAYWRIGNTPFEREARHAEELSLPLPEPQEAALWAAVRRGWPVGPERFIAALGEQKRPVQPRRRGRPRSV